MRTGAAGATLDMARAPSHPDDPALDAAALLRRIGFFGILVVVPVAAQVARRASVVVAPIAIILLVIASAIDRRHRPLRQGTGPLLRAPAALAGLLLLGWTGLSLTWTPFPIPAIERFLNLLATILLTLAGYLALPDRMRSANLYLLPLGVAASAILAVLIGLFGTALVPGDFDGDALERGTILLAVLVWPAVAWLRSRTRDIEALVLAATVAGSLLLARTALPLVGFSLGALAYGASTVRTGLGTRATAIVLSGLVALAPLLPLVARPIGLALVDKSVPGMLSIITWQRLVTAEPLRLVTGHGFETALRGRVVGLVPPSAPSAFLFELWFELGLVGAFAAAFALYAAIRRSAVASAPLVPGAMGAFVTAYAMSCLGSRPAVAWWLTTLALTALVFVAVERGQFRSRRPKLSVPVRAATPVS